MLDQFQHLIASSSNWLWLFVVAFIFHAIEEVKDLGVGIKRSAIQFGVLTGGVSILLAVGVQLARSFGYPQFFGVILGTAFCLNGLSHISTTLRRARYNPGVVTGTLLFLPLGITVVVKFSHTMGRPRYLIGVVIGIAIQVIATLLRL